MSVDEQAKYEPRLKMQSHEAAPTRVLVRATSLDARVSQFANDISSATGYPVSFVIDERKGKPTHNADHIIGITDKSCQSLGLYCPPDYAWRCGDYGYYLARKRYPDVRLFWMIEYDVRFIPNSLKEFFTFFEDHEHVDFLATNFGPSDWSWYWAATLKSNNTKPFRCLFPITRMSATAIDAVLHKRAAHSRRTLRRRLWPNDEAMVSTTLENAGYSCKDINGFGRHFYNEARFSFEHPIDGDAFLQFSDDAILYHPVLYDAQYTTKVARLKSRDKQETLVEQYSRRLLGKANSYFAW